MKHVGIDYSLFIMSRSRAELRGGRNAEMHRSAPSQSKHRLTLLSAAHEK
ncbi:hypothetical protein [Rhodococcus tibetensis]|uniref:Uncharacterized protein n=1 Tax=Rhodococcus tibetensis TaxID=2965064 RepID=A0ABT1QKM9_9NOCA|nr:hypothetical protein [Rhodococcus sp. FXJ9.536]MCQ4122814.1 hypothetical protein [Rhodococcus sp. FXJ9.536]